LLGNYFNIFFRLSRARRIVENAFGILSQTWRVLLNRIEMQVDSINKITLVCCILHNLLRMSEFGAKKPALCCTHVSPPVSGSYGYDIRSKFADWCIAEGDVSFQHKIIDQ